MSKPSRVDFERALYAEAARLAGATARPEKLSRTELIAETVRLLAQVSLGEGGGLAGAVSWANVSDKPIAFPPSTHDHDARYYTESEVDALLAGAGGGDSFAALPSFSLRPEPVFTTAQSAWVTARGGKIYYPALVHARAVLPAALDEFYLYYSSDHDAGAGGIGLATAPAPWGPYTDRGLVYTDTAAGSQTETPSVVWDPVGSRFNLYYQQKLSVSDQSTLLATSADGRTAWTRVGLAITATGRTSGNGHTGYARVYRSGGRWVAHHLMGGTNRAHYGVSYSPDGVTWFSDTRAVPAQPQLAENVNTRRLAASQFAPFSLRGLGLALGVSGPFVSGGISSAKRLKLLRYESPRRYWPVADVLLPGARPWCAASVEQPCVVAWRGVLYAVFLAQDANGVASFGLLEGRP